jgi:hypothetical protein
MEPYSMSRTWRNNTCGVNKTTEGRQNFEPIECKKRWLGRVSRHLCKDIKHNDGNMKVKSILSDVYVKVQSR